MNVLDAIRKVFDLEIDALINTRSNLDESYARAVEVLFQCSGKVVVTGMGKSGIIAQKIAATMVSTGTPAFFLHSGEGMHGDVGIIREEDVILAISKSGETEELLNVLLYAEKKGVPTISITANPSSTLGKKSNVVLFTPVNEEACPLNLAPTSSTTAALVVGDALAMTLMRVKDFQPEHFAWLHPGGQLGKRLLLTVADIMRTGDKNPIVSAKATIKDMLCEITSKCSGAVSIVNEQGNLLGLVTDYDIRKALDEGQQIFSMSIPQIMNHNPTYVYSDEKASAALNLMENREKPFMVLPVLGRTCKKVVGMVHLHDLVAKGL